MGYSSTVLVVEYHKKYHFWGTHLIMLILATPGTRLVLVLKGQCTWYLVKKKAPSTRVDYIWFLLEITN